MFKQVCILSFSAVCALQAQVPVVENGKALAKIYLTEPEGDTELLEAALDDFNAHVAKMTGQRLEVVKVSGKEEVQEPAIVLGGLAETFGVKPKATEYQESVQLLVKERTCFIAGESNVAVVNGLYTLLQEWGCEWVMPGEAGDVIPQTSSLEIPVLSISHTPGFPERKMWYTGGASLNTKENFAAFELWKRRQRMTGSPVYPTLGHGHIWDRFIKRHKAEFEKDPTMYALVRQPDGTLVRKGPQLEATHPRVLELFVEEIHEAFRKNGWPKDKDVAFGIGPADGLGYSESAEAMQLGGGQMDPVSGYPDQTDLLVRLGNEILTRVEKDYPKVSLGYYAYWVHGDYPVRYKPHPRLNQIFAPITFSRYHSVMDTNSKSWPYYREVVEKWSALAKEQGNRLSYRGYNWNLAENMSPFSKLRIYGEELPWYHEKGFTSVNTECVKAWGVTGPSDFLMAKLLWDPSADWRKVLTHFCAKSYGKGAETMERYWLNLTERQHAAGHEAGSYHALHLMYDAEFIKAQKGLIREAIAAAEHEPEKTRALYALQPLEQMELLFKVREAGNRFDFAAAEQLYGELHAHWEKAHAMNSQVVSAYAPRYLKRFLESYIQDARKFSSPPYKLEQPLEEQLTTMLDPYNVGERLGFQSPDLNDTNYLKTHTWSMPWDAQGLGAYRNGSVWYRVPFERTGKQTDMPLGLFLGGVDDQVFVWLNGKAVGQSRVAFSRPFAFDLTPHVQEGRNLLAVKVVRFNAGNELGTGGLLRPSFLIGGARVEAEADTTPQRRVLPGGELGEVEK